MWAFLAVFVVTLAYSYAKAPKPQNAPRPALTDIQAPTAEDGRTIPVLGGTRDLNGPNVVWYGHLRTVAIKSKGGKK